MFSSRTITIFTKQFCRFEYFGTAVCDVVKKIGAVNEMTELDGGVYMVHNYCYLYCAWDSE